MEMLKDKRGWGLKEMLILSGILALFLIIAIYYIYTLYQSLDLEVTQNYYHDLEDKLEYNAHVYLEDYYDKNLDSTGVTITRSILRAYDLDVNLKDNKGKACSGYVIAKKTHGEEIINAYISCPNYMTDGYEDWRSS